LGTIGKTRFLIQLIDVQALMLICLEKAHPPSLNAAEGWKRAGNLNVK
jgi:hypothetical protein